MVDTTIVRSIGSPSGISKAIYGAQSSADICEREGVAPYAKSSKSRASSSNEALDVELSPSYLHRPCRDEILLDEFLKGVVDRQ